MKSIEERAKEFTEFMTNGGSDSIAQAINNSYKAGCYWQRDIDIQKAAEWWESRCDYLGISKYQIELFKKAMEEQS